MKYNERLAKARQKRETVLEAETIFIFLHLTIRNFMKQRVATAITRFESLTGAFTFILLK